MTTSKLIVETAKELELFFKDNTALRKNDPALQRVKQYCAKLSACDSYVAEKAGEIKYLSSLFFSARKHNALPGGADEIYHRIVDDLLNRIVTRASAIAYDERKV